MTYAEDQGTGARRSIALAVSVGVHALLLLFFILYSIITPIPPVFETEGSGGGAGTEVALGLELLGQGANDSPPAPSEEAAPPPVPDETTPLTNDADDESPAIVETPVKEKPKDKPTPKPERRKPTEEEIRREKQRKIDEMMGNKGNGDGGRGNDGVPGTAGVPNGTPGGTGKGDGTGVYIGSGTRIDLPGYMVKNKPSIKERPNVGGKVVMDIWVSPEGKVLRASQNVKLSTTLDQTLVEIAKRACMASSFYPNAKATSEQRGTIAFNFQLE